MRLLVDLYNTYFLEIICSILKFFKIYEVNILPLQNQDSFQNGHLLSEYTATITMH